MIYYCLLFIFHYLQDLVLQRAICILGHTHDQKIYYTSMSEPCADYLGKQNIHYIITRIFFRLVLKGKQSCCFLPFLEINVIWLVVEISVQHIFLRDWDTKSEDLGGDLLLH